MQISRNNYFLLTVLFIIYYIINWFFLHHFMSFNWVFIFQLALVLLAYSKAGSWVMRLLYDCQPIKTKEDKEKLSPLFLEVYQNAILEHKKLNPTITLYIDNSSEVNAYALGTDTIVITRGAMLQLNNEQIKGVLAHELGHIAHGDTFISIFIMLGNLIFMSILALFKIVKAFFQLVTDSLEDSSMKPKAINLFVGSLYVLVLLFVQCMLMINSRQNEYQADDFALNIGYVLWSSKIVTLVPNNLMIDNVQQMA